jgi:hypothetical protein
MRCNAGCLTPFGDFCNHVPGPLPHVPELEVEVPTLGGGPGRWPDCVAGGGGFDAATQTYRLVAEKRYVNHNTLTRMCSLVCDVDVQRVASSS